MLCDKDGISLNGPIKIFIIVLLFVIILSASSANALSDIRWDPEGSPVCTAQLSQCFPVMVSDENGGAILSWEDGRSENKTAVYAQRIDYSGNSLWADNGVPVCDYHGDQIDPHMVPDGEGGAIIVWVDGRTKSKCSANKSIYAQRLNSEGVRLWNSEGVPICTAKGERGNPAITTDGDGGAIISWEDGRRGCGNWDIFTQRIDSNGNVQWSGDGISASSACGRKQSPSIISDGSGGAVISWTDKQLQWCWFWYWSSWNVYAQRISAEGSVMWNDRGVPVCTEGGDQINVSVTHAGWEGTIFAWQDKRNPSDGWDIYAQLLLHDGSNSWESNGIQIAAEANDQIHPAAVHDGEGGAYIAWQDGREIDWNIYAQRTSSAGIPQWASGGVSICSESGDQNRPFVLSDEAGGFYCVWEDSRSNAGSDIFAQRLGPQGNSKWEHGGRLICSADNSQILPIAVYDGFEGMIAAWQDSRSSDWDIYAQRVSEDAPTVTSVIPSFGYQGNVVNTDISGTGFREGLTAWLQGPENELIYGGAVSVHSDELISCSFDLNGATVSFFDVYVRNSDGQYGFLENGFQVKKENPPEVTSIDPVRGEQGKTINSRIYGSGFQNGASAFLLRNGKLITGDGIAFISSNEIRCSFNLQEVDIGLWDVVVENPDKQRGSLEKGFLVIEQIEPPIDEEISVTSIEPSSAKTGSSISVEISGTNFKKGAIPSIKTEGISINGSDVALVSDALITCTLDLRDASIGLWDVNVKNTDGQEGTLKNGFEVYDIIAPEKASEFFFAEGYTGGGFQEFLCLGNPGSTIAVANVEFLMPDGSTAESAYPIASNSRFTVDVNSALLSLTGRGGDVSVIVTSESEIMAERSMYFNYKGKYTGGHVAAGAPSSSGIWYFAEGYTGSGFEQWICIMNPGHSTANVEVVFQTQEEGTDQSKAFRHQVGGRSRATFSVNDVLGENYQNSFTVKSDMPVVVERPMYFDYLGREFRHWSGGHCVMGRTTLSDRYFFAEGTTRNGFDEWITLQNSGENDITVYATYQMGEGQGENVIKSYPVKAGWRETIFVPDEVGFERDMSVLLSSDSSFLAERPMYFMYTYEDSQWSDGHCVIGMDAPSTEWFLAEGYTGPMFHEWICIQNPGDEDALVEICYLTQELGALDVKRLDVPARSRKTVFVNDCAGCDLQLSARLSVLSGPPIVVERPMYFSYAGIWDGGSCEFGYPPVR